MAPRNSSPRPARRHDRRSSLQNCLVDILDRELVGCDLVVEKRRAHRIRVNLPARYRSSEISLDGEVSDLSCDGLFLRSEFLDSEGSRVDLHFELPGTGAPVRLSGEVVRIDETPMSCGMGIRFADVRLPTRLQLANYMLLQTSRAMQ